MNSAKYWFIRAQVSATVSKACSDAGFTDASRWFGNRAIYFLAKGLAALAPENAYKEIRVTAEVEGLPFSRYPFLPINPN